MKVRGHFRLAVGVSLAVHALALALLPWLGVWPLQRAETPPAPLPLMTLTVVSGAEGLPAAPALESTATAEPAVAPVKPLAVPALPPQPEAAPATPVPTPPPAPVPTSEVVAPEAPAPVAVITPPVQVALESSRGVPAVAVNAIPASEVSRGSTDDSAGVSSGPAYRRNPPPRYPAAARRRGEEGIVLLQVLVDVRGQAARVKVAASSGFPALDEAAADAARRWEFEPARQQGRPVAREVELPIRFVLERRSAR